MLNSFLLISVDREFIQSFQNALAHEMYELDTTKSPDAVALNRYPLILIFSSDAPLCLYKIRKVCKTPIIVIDDDSQNVCKYLEQGADDCMIMPVDFKELIARCRAVLRRSNTAVHETGGEVAYKGFTINKDSYELRVQNLPVTLSSREFEITYLLASNPNRVMTRDEILDAAFGKEYEGDLRAVDVHIKKIRDKVQNPQNVWEIKTVRGVGYKFSV